MELLKIARQITRSINKRGFAETISFAKRELVRKYMVARSIDGIHGTDTAGYIPLDELSVSGDNRKHGGAYQPIPADLFIQILESLAIEHQDYIFIDFGSGKGRTLLLASHYPFKKIIGVEFSPDLHAAAEANVHRYSNRRQRCFRIQPLCMDAMDFEIPSDPAVYFFFNPFDDVVMRAY